VFDAVWVNGILPGGTCGTNDSLSVQTVAVVVCGDTGGAVEQSSVSTFAAVLSCDTGTLRLDGVTDLGTAEGGFDTVLCWMFKDWIKACYNVCLVDWSVCAHFWILIDTVWTVYFTIAVNSLVE